MTKPKTCKVCDVLASLPRADAIDVNGYLLEGAIPASDFHAILREEKYDVGYSTVKKHRKEKHREF